MLEPQRGLRDVMTDPVAPLDPWISESVAHWKKRFHRLVFILAAGTISLAEVISFKLWGEYSVWKALPNRSLGFDSVWFVQDRVLPALGAVCLVGIILLFCWLRQRRGLKLLAQGWVVPANRRRYFEPLEVAQYEYEVEGQSYRTWCGEARSKRRRRAVAFVDRGDPRRAVIISLTSPAP
jgi:hypothetical protein